MKKTIRNIVLLLFLISSLCLYPATNTDTVWQIQSSATAANANGGGFAAGNVNFMTDLQATSATGNSPVVSSATYDFVAGDVGHWVYVKSGTNWTPGWYQIASVDTVPNPNTATLSAAIGQAIQRSTTTGYPTPKYGLNTVAGVATTASPTGGTFSVDYSQADAAPFSGTNLASTTATTNPCTVTDSGTPFSKNKVGNILHITAGTQWTQGWYEIVSVSGTTATLDRACGTNATPSGAGTWKIGGAISLGSSTANQTDSNFFSAAHISTSGGNRFFIKSGTITLGGAVTNAAGGTQLPHVWEGYQTTRGDSPLTTGRPTLAWGANVWTAANNNDFYFLNLTGTSGGTNPVLLLANNSKVFYTKIVNSSSTSGRKALSSTSGADNYVFGCELVSYRGQAFSSGTGSSFVVNNYIHDSDIGILDASTTQLGSIRNNIVESCVTNAIQFSGTKTGIQEIVNNTLYGSENTTGTGVLIATGTTDFKILNNILYGFATGVSHADAAQVVGFDDYNDYFNNDTNATNWQTGTHNLALNPTFTNVAQVTGTAGKFAAANGKLIDTSKDFTASGVVALQDYVYIVSGTGVTAGIYGISSISTTTNPNDTLNLDINPGTDTTADKVYQITTGHNFTIGTNLKAGGFPGAFPGALTTGYLDIGAVQRQEQGTSGGGLIGGAVR